jgi:hypothetical protein
MLESHAMSGRTGLRWVTAVALLCATAHPAFADGVPIDGWGTFFVMAGIVILVGFITLVLLLRWVFRTIASRSARRAADAAVPEARVVQDRSKPS